MAAEILLRGKDSPQKQKVLKIIPKELTLFETKYRKIKLQGSLKIVEILVVSNQKKAASTMRGR